MQNISFLTEFIPMLEPSEVQGNKFTLIESDENRNFGGQ